MCSVKKKLKEVEKKYPTIMSDISSLLKKKKITHTHSTNEIIVSSSTKKEITSIIDSLIDNASRDILLDIVEAKKSVYIRKKTK